MTVTYLKPGQLNLGLIGDPWLLVLGGVTRQGNRRARRAVSTALDSGLDVVWFDGHDQTDGGTMQRAPVEPQSPGGRLVIVDFHEAEARTMSSRLRLGHTLRANTVRRWIWRHFLRRIGSLLRPRACWTTIRPDIRVLSRHTTPDSIVYGDDFAITSAWYTARIWETVPVHPALQNGGG